MTFYTAIFLFAVTATCSFVVNGVAHFPSIVGQYRNSVGVVHFRSWALEKKFRLHPSAKLNYEEKVGVTVTVERAIHPQAEVVRCPNEYLVPPRLSSVHGPMTKKGAHFEKFEDKELLALRLLQEVRLGEDSEWAPYIKILPRPEQVNQPLWWSKDELSMLQGTFAYESIQSQFDAFVTFFAKVKESMYFSHPPSEHELKWAISIVNSRSFTVFKTKGYHRLNNKPFLAPLADLLNHDEETHVGWKLGSIKQSATTESYFRIFSLSKYAGDGELLMNNYNANISSVDLLVHYGFLHMSKSLPNDCLPLSFSIPASDPLYTEREKLCELLDIRGVHDIHGEREIPEKMMEFIFILQMSAKELAKSIQERKLIVANSTKHRMNVLQALKGTFEHMKRRLYNKTTTEVERSLPADPLRYAYIDRIISIEGGILEYQVRQLNMAIADLTNNLGEANGDGRIEL
eukprot:Stramenopile-MAST_4_protein_2496